MVSNLARRAATRWESLAASVEHARAYRAQRIDALESLDNAVRNAGAHLDSAQRRSCDQYATDVLGSRWHAPWLYVYTAMRGEFLEGWIPATYMGRWVGPAMSGHLGSLASTKTLTRRLLPGAPLPDLGYVLRGRWYDRDLLEIGRTRLLEAIAAVHDTVIVKRDGGYRGYQVRSMSLDELRGAEANTLGDAVIQERIRPHASLEAVVSGPVATYRIVTVRELDGEVTVRCGNVKFGRVGQDAVRGGSKFMVAVVSDDGRLAEIGHGDDWLPSPVHPETGRTVPGGRLPRYREAVELARGLHERFPHFGLIGWDLTVDAKEDVRLLEWNAGHIGVAYSEAIIGPSFTGLGWEHLHR